MNTVVKTSADTRPKLLLVDDEPTNLQVLRGILQADYRLLYARDGAKALELAAAELPELVLLDVMMPGEIDGIEACRRLRADSDLREVPIVMLSAKGQVSDRLAGMAAGANEYVVKPFEPALLQQVVQRLTADGGRT